jgi:hypothetical protein
MHKIMNKKFYLSPKFGTLFNKSWITNSELLHPWICCSGLGCLSARRLTHLCLPLTRSLLLMVSFCLLLMRRTVGGLQYLMLSTEFVSIYMRLATLIGLLLSTYRAIYDSQCLMGYIFGQTPLGSSQRILMWTGMAVRMTGDPRGAMLCSLALT